ncbi:ATP synthase F0 subunit C [Pajaroellobacter abortibovis]|uniref:ATP synthase subunit c n=1 Tax=Pajaroellobacter abortibovis TaxID=1882918 RepID=A0A1L6MYM4_9BACT|nr:ATP synthase F0 subunit C [Pajaroellobacter abortibovis]APS00569.1 F0F1 ATP synthase subunit C [Pajaroellobacter abortibovis]
MPTINKVGRFSTFFGIIASVFSLFPGFVHAAEGMAAGGTSPQVKAWAAISAGLAVGFGVIGGTFAQGRAVAAALEGISRNPGAAPRIQTPMILGLALIESLVLLTFVIAFFLQGKV